MQTPDEGYFAGWSAAVCLASCFSKSSDRPVT